MCTPSGEIFQPSSLLLVVPTTQYMAEKGMGFYSLNSLYMLILPHTFFGVCFCNDLNPILFYP